MSQVSKVSKVNALSLTRRSWGEGCCIMSWMCQPTYSSIRRRRRVHVKKREKMLVRVPLPARALSDVWPQSATHTYAAVLGRHVLSFCALSAIVQHLSAAWDTSTESFQRCASAHSARRSVRKVQRSPDGFLARRWSRFAPTYSFSHLSPLISLPLALSLSLPPPPSSLLFLLLFFFFFLCMLWRAQAAVFTDRHKAGSRFYFLMRLLGRR